MNKDAILKIRMTPAEISALDKLAMASGMNRSRYIRRLISIEKKDIFLKEENIKDLQTQFENINRLGTNLHQIAFNINMDRAVNYDIKKIITPLLQDISSNIKELKTQLVNLIKEHRG